jgi:Reverse transcriptase (RNA-dependent DNA polymerase).
MIIIIILTIIIVTVICLALISLTNMLNKQAAGYEGKGNNKVSHFFYMDDLELFSRDETGIQQDLTVVKTFNDDIRMEYGLEQCATAVFKHG